MIVKIEIDAATPADVATLLRGTAGMIEAGAGMVMSIDAAAVEGKIKLKITATP